jgi:hypothetical protein
MSTPEQFERLCAVPVERRVSGRSLVDIVRESGYSELRREFGSRDLAAYLRVRPDVVATWVAYSQDKRTSTGWYLRPPYSIGRIADESPAMHEVKHVDLAAACAAFIVVELGEILDGAPG